MSDFPTGFPPLSALAAEAAARGVRPLDEGPGAADTDDWFATEGESRLPLRVDALGTTDVDELVTRALSHIVG